MKIQNLEIIAPVIVFGALAFGVVGSFCDLLTAKEAAAIMLGSLGVVAVVGKLPQVKHGLNN